MYYFKAESKKISEKKITRLLSNDYFRLSLIAYSTGIVMSTHDLSVPNLRDNTSLINAFDLRKITKVHQI